MLKNINQKIFSIKEMFSMIQIHRLIKIINPFVVLIFFIIIFLINITTNINNANALLELDITKGYVEPIPLVVANFEYNNSENSIVSKDISGINKDVLQFTMKIPDIIKNDLISSGLFKIINSNAYLEKPSFNKQPSLDNWRKINATVLIVGNIEKSLNNGKLVVDFKIWDPYKGKLLINETLQIDQRSWRRIGHRIADIIYLKLIGENGYFDSRILFVAGNKNNNARNLKKSKRLAIMDYDGENFKFITDGKDMALTPRFHYKNQKAIYMSYKNKVPQVFILDITTGIQKLLGTFQGMTFAPRFSPDGEYAIMSMSKNGTTGIYEINLNTNYTKKLINDLGTISTSPSYSPDGEYIVFNSNRGGSRQLYIMDRDGSNIKRISFGDGIYATPVWSPRGDYIAFTKIYNNSFYIGVMKPDGSGERMLTTSWLEDGPTWAPNGRIILFERQIMGGESQLYSVDVSGYNEKHIHTSVPASDPAWSGLLK